MKIALEVVHSEAKELSKGLNLKVGPEGARTPGPAVGDLIILTVTVSSRELHDKMHSAGRSF